MSQQRCGLCGDCVSESGIIFRHTRRGERLTLSMVLCDGCGDRIEKHLKRSIPKRLMEIVPHERGGG